MRKLPVLSSLTWLLVYSFLVSLSACSGEKDKASTNQGSSSPEKISKTLKNPSSSAEALIPEKAIGFASFTTENPGYKEYANSPWGKSDFTKLLNTVKIEGINWRKLLDNAGVKPGSDNGVEKIAKSGLIYLMPEKNNDVTGGAFIETASGIDSEKLIQSLTQDLKAAGRTVVSPENPDTNVYTVSEVDRPGRDLYLASRDGMLAVSPVKPVSESFAKAEKPEPNPLFASEEFKLATAGFGSPSRRVYWGYVDIEQAISKNSEKFPLSDLAFEGAMADAPAGIARALIKKGDRLDKLPGAPGSASIGHFSGSPMLYLDVDGSLISYLIELDKDAGSKLSSLKSVSRASMIAKISEPGQFMLPIPSLSLVVQSDSEDNAKVVASELEKALGSMISGGGSGNWQEKDLGSGKMKFSIHQMGFGAFITTAGNKTFVAMSEKELVSLTNSTASDGKEKVSFASGLNAKSRKHLVDRPTLANIHMDNRQIATWLQNIGPLVQMFAAGSKEAAELVKPERIEQLKSQGTFTASLEREPGQLFLSYFASPG